MEEHRGARTAGEADEENQGCRIFRLVFVLDHGSRAVSTTWGGSRPSGLILGLCLSGAGADLFFL